MADPIPQFVKNCPCGMPTYDADFIGVTWVNVELALSGMTLVDGDNRGANTFKCAHCESAFIDVALDSNQE